MIFPCLQLYLSIGSILRMRLHQRMQPWQHYLLLFAVIIDQFIQKCVSEDMHQNATSHLP